MIDLALGDKVTVSGFATGDQDSMWEGREGVISREWDDTFLEVTFDDGCEKVWSKGTFPAKFLKKIGPNFKRADRVEIVGVHPNRGSFGHVIAVRTYAAPETTKYVVELEGGQRLNGIKGEYLNPAPKKELVRKFDIGQKVRYIGDGRGVFEHYQKVGTVKGYTPMGNVIVEIDEEPKGTVVHRVSDLGAIATEGKEIKREDLKVGMTIRAEYVTGKGEDYSQTSSKTGVISKITTGADKKKFPYATVDGHNYSLFYPDIDFTFMLIKDAPKVDPLVEQIEKLGAGSVVQFGDGSSVYTYVRTTTPGEWYGMVNNVTPMKVTDTTIKQALETPSGKILISK